jgi:hypothetical protein
MSEDFKIESKKPMEYLSQDEIQKVFDRSIKELNEFFEIQWTEDLPELKVLNSSEELEEAYGSKPKKSTEGFARGNAINLVAPKKLELLTIHKYSPKTYRALIKHETCHQFFRKICKRRTPKWLTEGTSLFVSKQNEAYKNPVKFREFLDFFDADNKGRSSHYLYRESGYAVDLLIKHFGKENFLNLLKANRDCDNYEDFKNKFKELYGFKLEYENFNKLLSDDLENKAIEEKIG